MEELVDIIYIYGLVGRNTLLASRLFGERCYRITKRMQEFPTFSRDGKHKSKTTQDL